MAVSHKLMAAILIFKINVGLRLGRVHEFMLTISKELEGRPEIQRMRQRS